MSSRIAAPRTRTSSNNHIESKHPGTRVPLSRISSNRIQHVAPANLKKSPKNTVPPEKEMKIIEPFIHKEVEIGDINDPQDVVEYEHIIYRTLRAEENSMDPLEFKQNEITLKDRDLLVDAICRFHYKLGLMTNTLYRFIGIFDRFLGVGQVPKSKLKLYGCAAFLIASKIEDIYPAQSDDLITLSERAFTKHELFQAEIQMINAIGFETTFATPLFYLTQFMRINGQTKETLLFARYILEIMQSNEKFFTVKPALQASVAVMVTRIVNEEETMWTSDLEGYTQYTVEQLIPLASMVKEMLLEKDRPETKFMRRKYGSDLFLNVAHCSIPSTWE